MESQLDTLNEKKRLRAVALKTRSEISPSNAQRAAQKLAENALSFLSVPSPKIISGYVPSRDEFDCLPLMAELEKLGHTLSLPVIEAKGKPLVFRSWQVGGDLEPGTFKVPVPPPSCPELAPDIFLVPLLLFDKSGYRLGYGGGFYDRTLQKARAERTVFAVGIAFDEQEVSHVPRETYDEQLDWILTASGAKKCKEG